MTPTEPFKPTSQAELAANPIYIILEFREPVTQALFDRVVDVVYTQALTGSAAMLVDSAPMYSDGFGHLIKTDPKPNSPRYNASDVVVYIAEGEGGEVPGEVLARRTDGMTNASQYRVRWEDGGEDRDDEEGGPRWFEENELAPHQPSKEDHNASSTNQGQDVHSRNGA